MKRLRVTGGGVGGNNDDSRVPGDPVEIMDFYIPSTGPEQDTPGFAINLWGMILYFLYLT